MPKSYIYIGSHSSGKQHHIRDTAGEQQRGVYKNRSEVCHEPRPAVANTPLGVYPQPAINRDRQVWIITVYERSLEWSGVYGATAFR
ncbi:uncharacterized protein YALI1_D01456g [Yarrowia lipolytica]|uniref:Uncharacterized protein n=1 Tax=Yarrowia lipolytica TaxID=4952 RepID=A0A1D8NCR0_YARLL|nr:hypothetical protein YALI1_D01456g [Yarrowia lipolytica]